MLTLMLFRHAKSSWDHPGLDDHDRPLNERGVAAASRMGRHIRHIAITPDLVLCSTAVRARQTWALAQTETGCSPPCELSRALYNFDDGNSYLNIVKQLNDDCKTVMLVGHNPTTEGLAKLLSGDGDPAALTALARKYPTAALSVIRFDLDHWRDVGPGTGTLMLFARPKQLPDTDG